MIVTVQETIEHSRDITAEMVEAYLDQRDWKLCYEGPWTRSWSPDGSRIGLCVTLPQHWTAIEDDDFAHAVNRIAKIEGRKPHDVLADIAEGR